VIAGATLGLLGGMTLAWLQTSSDGWFLFYTLDLPHYHPIDQRALQRFWLKDLFLTLPVLTILTAGFFIAASLARKRTHWDALAFIAGLIGAGLAGRLHSFGWFNTLIPAHLALALAGPLALSLLSAQAWKKVWQRHAAYAICAACVIFQTVDFARHPGKVFPAPGDEARNAAFLKEMEHFQGNVLLPDYCFPEAGKDVTIFLL
jgi:hypothetical protein